MTMTIAFDAADRVVSIEEVPSGLRCACRCTECQEPLIARKGKRRIHHFSHASQKVPCDVQPESFLHRYAKLVVREALGMQLPPFPDHTPESEDRTSWWDFESVQEELWMGDFRPDLVAHLCDGPLLIEFACTSFVDAEKQARIERAGIRTIEVDLSRLEIDPTAAGLVSLKAAILHEVSTKKWVYPLETELLPEQMIDPGLAPLTAICVEPQSQPIPERTRFTIHGMWVDLRELGYGSVIVRSVCYNPLVVDLLKVLARRYGGHYVTKYKNWMFPAWTKQSLLDELAALAEDK